jgi:hypothetical protein
MNLDEFVGICNKKSKTVHATDVAAPLMSNVQKSYTGKN